MKKLLCILLAVCLFVTPDFSVSVFAAEATGSTIIPYGETRDIVLVLDASGSMRNTPIAKMKEAALKFCESVLNAEGDNKIAIVAYSTDVSSTLNFTEDLYELRRSINNLTASGGTNIYAGFEKAKELLDSNMSSGRTKNIILLTDGLPEDGVSVPNGKYNGMGPSYSTPYGNALYTYFNDILNATYNVYTLGFFHSLSGTNLTYAQTLLSDIQNKGYYEVRNVEDIVFTFGDIAEDIVSDEDKNCPIVFVPGVMGSNLYLGSDKVWSPAVIDVLNPFSRLSDKMDISKSLNVHNYNYNQDGRQNPINQALLAKGSREYGAQETYENIIDGLVDGFTDENGNCTRSIYFFSYDFRQDNARSAQDLSTYISHILQDNPGHTKVDIVAHSMGGLVTSKYVDDWGTGSVRKIITAGTPYEGAPKLVNSVLTTEVLDNNITNFVLWSLGGLTKETKASFSAIAQLAPTERYYNANNTLFQQYEGIKWDGWFNFHKEYKTLSLSEYNAKNTIVFGENATDAINFHNDILNASGYNLLTGLDNTYFLVGINQKTISGIIYDNDTTLSSIGVKDVFYENKGDGTVPYDSSSIVKQIDELPAERVHKMSGTHTGILQKSEGINWVLDVLKDNINGPSSDELIKRGFIVIRIACPVDVTATLNGESLSSDINTLCRETSFGILDFFGEEADIKMLCLDPSDAYNICLNGTGEGVMDYSIRYFNVEGVMEEEYNFTNVDITDTTIITTGSDRNNLLLNVDQDGDGTIDRVLDEGDCTGNGMMVKNSDTSYTYTSNSLEVNMNIVSQYNDQYNMDVVVTNKTGETIHDWVLAYDSADQINHIWNGIVTENGEATIVKNAGYNQDIDPYQSVSFGYIATKREEVQIPTTFRLLNEYTTASEMTYEVDSRIDTDWGTGYNGSIVINNLSDQAIEDWVLEFDFAEKIDSMWGAEIVSCENGHYVIRNTVENHNIQPGSVVTIGFSVSERTSHDLPLGYTMSSVTVENY